MLGNPRNSPQWPNCHVETEYRALGSIVSEIIWLNGLLKDLHVFNLVPIPVYCDSKAAIQIASNLIYHEKTKHIEIDCHFMREKLQDGLISLKHVASSEKQADILIKALGRKSHEQFLFKLGTLNIFGSNLRGSVQS